ncbi:hypothetical protein AVEN_107205-1 [Araneus ventricosus]|uniref:Uncharacterized protein n=1 Tax=Araneus ventricosus TaxID=182803 RepID=A0A4Y2JEF1_ARAVE|nr:hypothetical protein AVEN_107205-1 [Araneus ventricosus]
MNIIENIWDALLHAVEKRSSPPPTPMDLLQDSWCEFPPGYFQTIVESMPRRLANTSACSRGSDRIIRSSPKELSSQRLASIPRGLRTPVSSAESRAEILTSNLPPISRIESRISNPLSESNLFFLSKTLNFKLLRRAPMRRGRNVMSQGFVELLTAASNRKPRSLSHLIIRRGRNIKGFV